MRRDIASRLREAFGDPIGSYAGDAPVGVRDERSSCIGCGLTAEDCCCPESGVCPSCGMMPIEGECSCSSLNESAEPCDECGMYEVEGSCGCTHLEEKKKKGPTKKTAQKILKGTKSFKEKIQIF